MVLSESVDSLEIEPSIAAVVAVTDCSAARCGGAQGLSIKLAN